MYKIKEQYKPKPSFPLSSHFLLLILFVYMNSSWQTLLFYSVLNIHLSQMCQLQVHVPWWVWPGRLCIWGGCVWGLWCLVSAVHRSRVQELYHVPRYEVRTYFMSHISHSEFVSQVSHGFLSWPTLIYHISHLNIMYKIKEQYKPKPSFPLSSHFLLLILFVYMNSSWQTLLFYSVLNIHLSQMCQLQVHVPWWVWPGRLCIWGGCVWGLWCLVSAVHRSRVQELYHVPRYEVRTYFICTSWCAWSSGTVPHF